MRFLAPDGTALAERDVALANQVVGNKLATDVLASAKFYAQLNYALANAAIASWDSK